MSRYSFFNSWPDHVILPLAASLKDELDWSAEKVAAQTALEQGKKLVWEIDFQFSWETLDDSSVFFAHTRALEESMKLICNFSKETLGVCLYRGDLSFSPLMAYWKWEEPFHDWLEELVEKAGKDHELRVCADRYYQKWVSSSQGEHYFRLFSITLFAEYLHRLISCMPEELLPFIFFDASKISSPSLIAQLVSPVRFAYLYTRLQAAAWPLLGDLQSNLGFLLPSDPYCDREVLSQLDRHMHECRKQNIAFRILTEEKLSEEWDNLDQLIIIPQTLTPQVTRKLQGFVAAGGRVLKDPIAIPSTEDIGDFLL